MCEENPQWVHRKLPVSEEFLRHCLGVSFWEGWPLALRILRPLLSPSLWDRNREKVLFGGFFRSVLRTQGPKAPYIHLRELASNSQAPSC